MSRAHGGFAYLFLLYLIAILSVATLAVAGIDRFARIREEEAELLRIGHEYREALRRYHEAHMPHVYPESLDALLEDRSSGELRRYLRRIYVDPIARKKEWGVVLQEGRIVGVHSLSVAQPLKVGDFSPEDVDFSGAGTYADWVFSPLPLERRNSQVGGSEVVADR